MKQIGALSLCRRLYPDNICPIKELLQYSCMVIARKCWIWQYLCQPKEGHRVVKLLFCAYYYYYYFIYLNSLLLLLLLLHHIFKQPITITITITRNIEKAYYYYYYFSNYYYYYYFLITITFIITFEPKKHNTSRLQSNIQRLWLLPLYHTIPQTHYHR